MNDRLHKDFRLVFSIAMAAVIGPGGPGAIFEGFQGAGMANAAFAGFTSGAIASGNLTGAIQGSFTASMFYGAGNVIEGTDFVDGTQTPGAMKWGKPSSVALHAVVGCVTSAAGGGQCGAGALSAAFSKAAAVNGFTDASNQIEGVIKSAVLGGTGSVLGGVTIALRLLDYRPQARPRAYPSHGLHIQKLRTAGTGLSPSTCS